MAYNFVCAHNQYFRGLAKPFYLVNLIAFNEKFLVEPLRDWTHQIEERSSQLA